MQTLTESFCNAYTRITVSMRFREQALEGEDDVTGLNRCEPQHPRDLDWLRPE